MRNNYFYSFILQIKQNIIVFYQSILPCNSTKLTYNTLLKRKIGN
ncbi:hypothetical protein GGR97_002829 [Wenyingzhuangia aestuarii]|nr:hypothetical protein [Wenyingzhuangia aestuarii]